jgi:N-acetyl-gamma-glutamyl-phosphate reductase
MKTRVGIVGFRGYSGAELVHMLAKHPKAEPWLMEHRADTVDRSRPKGFQGPPRIACTAEAAAASKIRLVFLATPPEVSMELAPPLLAAGVKVVDLSGAYRLRTVENYARWYKAQHAQPELLAEAAYGLPEFYRDAVKGARLVANPGCYPTAANLALGPLAGAGAIDRAAGIVCDAKSGVSGSGRKPTLKNSFCEVTENFSAYSILSHRHVPEVLMNSGLAEGEFSFVAHLLPVDRGILETIYVRLRGGLDAEALVRIYEDRYRGEPFVRIYEPGETPDLHAVRRTNFCDIGVKVHAPTGRAVIVSAIDNLVKGAAGQAMQNMNLMLGWAEAEGIL